MLARVLKHQTEIACWVSGLIAVVIGLQTGLSALMGALTWLIPNQMFYRYFAQDIKASPEIAVRAFYKGVSLKIISILVLFVCMLQSPALKPASFFTMFALMQLLFWGLSFKESKAESL